MTEIKLYYIFWTGLRNCFFRLKTEQNRNFTYQTSLKEEKMKDKIITYGKEYVSNFKQNPLSATAVLIMQIIFVLGWGVYFYYILGNIITIVIPGQSGPKSNIYVECADIIIQALVYTYIFCRLFPNMFAVNKGFRLKIYAVLISAVFALISGEFSIARFIPRFSDNVPTAFWAVQEGENK